LIAVIGFSMLACASGGGNIDDTGTGPGGYKLGDTGPGGGKIFYISTTGFTVQGYGSPGDLGYFATYTAHYLEAASSIFGPKIEWGDKGGTLVAGITTTTKLSDINDVSNIGQGRKDTLTIVAHMNSKGESGRAAQLCAASDFGGKTDWFLPSLSELYLLYQNRAYAGLANEGWFSSSSQYDINWSWVVAFQGEDGGKMYGDSKNGFRSACAVRAF